jgi:oligopeptide/dipeptide ABC transporter ATP-binding protein
MPSGAGGRDGDGVNDTLLELRDMSKHFPGRSKPVLACRDVSFSVHDAEVVGLVGESGSGKSTIANISLGLVAPTSGEALFAGQQLSGLSRRTERALRARIQAVFQEPFLALDSRRSIGWAIEEPLRIHRTGSKSARRKRVRELLVSVGLDPEIADRKPSQLSGGQLQRVNIARALALNPALLVCDEPVSALDVSVQAQILNLFLEIQRTLGIAMLFISHDLAVVRHISDRIVVMYAGRVVEEGPTEVLCDEPHHPYTQALLRAAPEPDPDVETPAVAHTLRENVPEHGCPLVPRCPLAEPACSTFEPVLTETTAGRFSACRRAELLMGGPREGMTE